jgi:Transaldolase/Fructose-6-phosphate aldolase
MPRVSRASRGLTNLFIKIPAAHQGHAAIAACLAEGISINVTLIFSLSRYGAVMDAFLDGMERAHMRRPSCAADGRSRTPNWLTSTTSGVLLPAVGQGAGGRSPAATAAVGVDVDQGPGLSRHPLCG